MIPQVLVSPRMSVRLPACNYLKALEWAFAKFYTEKHYRKIANTLKFWFKTRKSKGKVVSVLN
jgi:hypothetical protein